MSCIKPKYAPFPSTCPYQPETKSNCTIKDCTFYEYTLDDLITDDVKVSVLMPYYYKSPTISKAIVTVVNQTFKNFELIIVNDGEDISEDQLISIEDSRIKYIDLKGNYGQAVARNEAFKASSGNYIAYLDADDEWFEDHLEKSLSAIIQGYHFIYGNFYYKNYLMNGSISMVPYTYEEDVIYNIGEVLKVSNPISINSVIHRRDVFIAAGGFEPGVVCGEDGVLWRRMYELGAKFGFKELPTSYYCRYDETNPYYHQSKALRMPSAIEGKHLISNGTNGQELDNQDTYKERVKDLKDKGLDYVPLRESV